MARNLQAKLSPKDSVRLFDVNKGAMEKLAAEMNAQQAGGATVELAESAADASKDAVCDDAPPIASPLSIYPPFLSLPYMMSNLCSIYDLSWGQLAGLPMILKHL